MTLRGPSATAAIVHCQLDHGTLDHVYWNNEIYDAECLKLINEYFYGVRIFPGQDPIHTYVGWVTTQYHCCSKEFNQDYVMKSSVVIADEYDRVVER